MKKLILATILILIFSCSKDKKENSVNYIDYDKINKNLTYNDTIQKDSISHSSIIVDKIKYNIVEGDLLLNEYEYIQYQLYGLVKSDTILENAKLVVEIKGDTVVKWPPNYIIKYCIAKGSFKTINNYNLVKDNMKKAVSEWEKTCNVKFFYDEAKDAKNILTPTKDLTFIVMEFDSKSNFLASAFFPYDIPTKRRLLIDPTYFISKFDKIGILRHELGHTIGFRHEHIRDGAPLLCPRENLRGTSNVTVYDPKSVMHYFCGDMGTIKLEITDIDKQGSQSIYGPPTN